jgi:hypothetical protein
MAGDVDLFVLYRWSLAIVCAVYTVVRTGQSLWGWLAFFSQSRRTAVLGRYAGVLLLRTRMQRFAWELGQIAVLSAVLGYVIYLHRTLGHSI